MVAFTYRAYRENGSAESGVVEANDKRDASRKLAQSNMRAYFLEEVGGSHHRATSSRAFTPWWQIERSTDFPKLLADLSVLLDAGFNIAAALRVVASSETSASERAKLVAISDQIANGKSLSETISSLPNVSADMSAMIASGETSGKIAQVISRMSEGYRYRAERRTAIVEALIYPAFLLVMVVGALLFLSLFLMPAIEPVFESGTVEKPIVVSLLSGFGRMLGQNWPIVFGAMVALAAIVILALRTPMSSLVISRALMRIPFIGRIRRESAIVRYLDTLSLLTENGVAMIESLRLASLTCSVSDMKRSLELVRDNVANGERLQSALKRTAVFDDPTLSLIGIGEESNKLPLLLKRASILVEARQKRAIDRMVTFLTPAITIGLGLLIGGLVVSVMTALLSINEIAVQ